VPWIDADEEIRDVTRWFGDRGKELWIKPHGVGFQAVVMELGVQSGQALVFFADSEVEAARTARRAFARSEMKDAVRAVGRIAQTQAGQMLIAEVALARLPLFKKAYARQAALGAAVWMADGRNRQAVRGVGSAAIDLARVSAGQRSPQELAAGSRRAIEPAIRLLAGVASDRFRH
jgi:hypothetical protein